MSSAWQLQETVNIASPTLALAVTADGLLAAGFGGVARYAGGGWELLAALPLRSVTALVTGRGVLLAGGDGGLARSGDGGRLWQRCIAPDLAGPVSSLALSPHFADDGVALAATIGNGILRSSDGGRSWAATSFGLPSSDVFSLAWVGGETVFASTAAGLARSPNGGRAWRLVESAPLGAWGALALLVDGELLAASEHGPLLRSSGKLTEWSAVPGLPDDVGFSAFAVVGDRILAGSEAVGVLVSGDDGKTWARVSPASALCFAADETHVWMGAAADVMQSEDGGMTWHALSTPPLHDLQRLQLFAGRALLTGLHSAPLIGAADDGWAVLDNAPLPQVVLAVGPAEELIASSPDGLFRSADQGQAWQPVIVGVGGSVTQITFDAEGVGWAGLTADGALLRSGDGGRSWVRREVPFGVLPVVALQAASGMLIAATYDARQGAVCLWRSEDEGEYWTRGGDAIVSWPVVATCADPLTVIVGSTIAVRQRDGSWRRATVGSSDFRRVVSNGATLFALATDALWRSDDLGATWERDDAGLASDETLDIAFDDDMLCALLRGGRVAWRKVG